MSDAATGKPSDFAVAVKDVSDELDADIFLFSGAINSKNYGALVTEVAKPKKHNNALLILTTNGGQANAAYKIARLLQRTYKRFLLFTPRYCYSAGTLVALGAHELIMDQFSELGPLDVQLLKKNELGDQKSGLLSASTFQSLSEASFKLFEHFMTHIIGRSSGLISFNVASKIAADMTGQTMAPIFAQVNPDIVGSDYRDLQVAVEYGTRLIKTSKNAEPNAVMELVTTYPAHDFIIDDEEAKTLFKSFRSPPESLYRLIGPLAPISYGQATPAIVMKLETSKSVSSDGKPEAASGNPRDVGRANKAAPKRAKRPVARRGRRDRQGN